MKHARPDYDRIQDPAGHIPDDEPVFLVRGQDKFGWIICVLYAIINYLCGEDKELTGMALKHAGRMHAWPKKVVPDYKKHMGAGHYMTPNEKGEYE